METPSRMDPLLLQLVDHSLEVHGNTIKLAGEEVIDALSNRPKSEAATPTEAMTPLVRLQAILSALY